MTMMMTSTNIRVLDNALDSQNKRECACMQCTVVESK